MAISGIGIQQITPRSGTGWQAPNPAPDRSNDSDVERTPPRKRDRAPAMPGTGQVVDKIA